MITEKPPYLGFGLGLRPQHYRGDPRRQPGHRLVRGHLRELHDRRRPAAAHARPDPRALSDRHAWRLALDRLHRSLRHGLSQGPEGPRQARPAEMDLRSPLLDRRARREPARSPAHPLHRRKRSTTSSTASITCRIFSAARLALENVSTYVHLRPIRDDRMGVLSASSRGAPDAGSCSTSTTSMSAPSTTASIRHRLSCNGMPRDRVVQFHVAGHSHDGDPHHRHPRPSGVRRGVGPLSRGARAISVRSRP